MTVLRFFVRNIKASVPPVFRFLSKKGEFETNVIKIRKRLEDRKSSSLFFVRFL